MPTGMRLQKCDAINVLRQKNMIQLTVLHESHGYVFVRRRKNDRLSTSALYTSGEVKVKQRNEN